MTSAYVPVHVSDEGLPWWQVLPLTVLGCAIAVVVLYLLSRWLQRRKR